MRPFCWHTAACHYRIWHGVAGLFFVARLFSPSANCRGLAERLAVVVVRYQGVSCVTSCDFSSLCDSFSTATRDHETQQHRRDSSAFRYVGTLFAIRQWIFVLLLLHPELKRRRDSTAACGNLATYNRASPAMDEYYLSGINAGSPSIIKPFISSRTACAL